MKQLVFILLLTVSVLAANAQTFTANALVYSINEGNTSVTVIGHVDGTEATGSIVIPSTVSYNGMNYPVTAIGRNAFINSHKLHGTLTIGSNVKDIGYGAFASCDSLSGNLIIPNSVINIDNYAFDSCKGFTGSLTIPNSVLSIGVCAFIQCSGFNGTLTIGSSVTDIGNLAFTNCSNINRAVCLAVEPPVLNYAGSNMSSVFYGFGCSTITVPCGSKEAYENSWWKTSYGFAWIVHSYGFETIIEDCEQTESVEISNVSISPNPAKDCIHIKVSDNATCQSINIFSIDGRLVETFPETSQQTTIDISGLNVGIYIMKVCLDNGNEYVAKIIKE